MLARADRSGDLWERGLALIWSAYALVGQGNVDEATQAGQEALAIFERLNNPFGVSVASGITLGNVSMARGDIAAAKAHFLHGAQAAEAITFLRVLQTTSDSLGTLALLEGDTQQAQQHFLKSLRISQGCGQTREILASLRDLAQVSSAQGDLATALQLLAVVLHHPASDQHALLRPERLRDEAENLRAQIESQLDRPRYQEAWETGQRRSLAEVVSQILDEGSPLSQPLGGTKRAARSRWKVRRLDQARDDRRGTQ
jgi:tetratricopeptide (TPR) repeat protein